MSKELSWSYVCAVVNNDSGTSQGFGFIKFLDVDERDRSIAELDGLTFVGTKPVTMQIAETPQPQSRWARHVLWCA